MIRKILQDPVYALKMLRIRTGKIFGGDKYRKFLMLTRNRTGSNMLVSMLNSHPAVYAEYEIFREIGDTCVDDILQNIYTLYPDFIKAVGFKIFYHHPIDDKSGRIWTTLNELKDVHIIHLKRRNILRTVLSKKIADLTDTWVNKNGNRNDASNSKKVLLSEDELYKAFERTRAWESEYEEKLRSRPLIDVYYEDIVAGPKEEFRKITDFLGLQPVSPKTKLKKQNPEKMNDLIVNYEELKKRFTGSEWEPFFEE